MIAAFVDQQQPTLSSHLAGKQPANEQTAFLYSLWYKAGW